MLWATPLKFQNVSLRVRDWSWSPCWERHVRDMNEHGKPKQDNEEQKDQDGESYKDGCTTR